jgi:hypothetical protein
VICKELEEQDRSADFSDSYKTGMHNGHMHGPLYHSLPVYDGHVADDETKNPLQYGSFQ